MEKGKLREEDDDMELEEPIFEGEDEEIKPPSLKGKYGLIPIELGPGFRCLSSSEFKKRKLYKRFLNAKKKYQEENLLESVTDSVTIEELIQAGYLSGFTTEELRKVLDIIKQREDDKSDKKKDDELNGSEKLRCLILSNNTVDYEDEDSFPDSSDYFDGEVNEKPRFYFADLTKKEMETFLWDLFNYPLSNAVLIPVKTLKEVIAQAEAEKGMESGEKN